MQQLFVTGVSGLLGTNLCHDLLDKGYHIKGLVRNKNSYKGNLHKNLELVEGHLFSDFENLLATIDVVIHIAAITDQSLVNYDEYWKVNCNATIQLHNTAVKNKVKRFIFVSTANTIGYGSIKNLGTEHNEMSSLFRKSFYAKSKYEAENYLVENHHKMDTIIINPTFMLGAYDSKPSSGKIILMGWKKKIIFYPPGGKNFVHVKDVSQGIINAIDKGISGEKYLIANENLSYREFFRNLKTIANQKSLMIMLPKQFLRILGYFGSFLRKFGITSSLSTANMKALCIDNYFSNEKSVKDLKLVYQPIDNAITDAIDYFSNLD
ncbi:MULTISPECIES: NAD-dependent epimerase/dehydratase family protein [unclassified Tenacibaculum]|uniref:NAD-dependent epimerase/dehydratase family protein n=1 Tax=unclassified Tenacibaculum TaxID=2635139 RepID=UPI001F30C70D|nr:MULTISPECIES: NAD-dependent epimerase/dehydratase family protein [unclassified Tenacibaculum]MCF2875732.1 NAD-dependent epimerase/dehydratase family protein [Tenacibaculum sp. Cn5-1]MCF2935808.1 NAD-dependent epimerase/dehydratase family protein [Tenacibaculum sp. Cn5-34]MCG7512368.1 NAD-dependent epimerase/dehydratase family protein [Tenacibaculum sp. Cn5-46]